MLNSSAFYAIRYNCPIAIEVAKPGGGTEVVCGTVFDTSGNLWNNQNRKIILDNGTVISWEDVIAIEQDEATEWVDVTA